MNEAAVIEVEQLSKRFGATEAVRGLSFSVPRGELFGFLGPNGAGKTTTIHMLCTLLAPTSGRALVAGYDTVRQPAQVRQAIGVVFQDPSLDEYLTAQENLEFYALCYHVPRSLARQRIAELLQLVELGERRRSLVRTFSGGMRRRLELARGLLHRPQVLFLDEPTLGLDPQTRARMWEYIAELQRLEGTTVFATTHYMEEAERCQRVAIIDHGQLVALDTPAALKAQVGGDVISLQVRDPAVASQLLRQAHGLEPQTRDGILDLRVQQGDALIPQLMRTLGEQTTAVSLRRPTLEDAFLALTGRGLRDPGPQESGDATPQRRPWGRRPS